MKIPLNEFEQIIDETILKRAMSYFFKGTISDFSEIAPGEFEATVLGTDEYHVSLQVKNNVVENHSCDCPYDMGPVCKHIVAVIFHLQQENLELEQTKTKKPKILPKKQQAKPLTQQIQDIVKVIPHDELIDFVIANTKKDKKFRINFFASFGHLSEDQTKKFYQAQIRTILKSVGRKRGWIDYADMKYIVELLTPFLENAILYVSKKKYDKVFQLSTSLLEELTEALQYIDDSNGELGYFIDSSIELLSELTKSELPAILKKEMFQYCIDSFEKRRFKGWDWHLGMLVLASGLTEKESEADIILACLKSLKDDYELEIAQSLKLDLLRKYKSEKEAEKFINKHITNPTIRANEIEIAFSKSDFDRVVGLSKGGVEFDNKKRPGLVKVWYNWLLKVAQAKNERTNIIEYAKHLLIGNFMPEQDYYQILKDNIEVGNWKPFLEELIKEISSKNRWTSSELIREIYIKEEWWDKLLEMLKQNSTLWNLQENEVYLTKDYSPELIKLYTAEIKNYLENNVGRTHYQTVCRFLRRMKKIGGNEEVIELVEVFRQQYPQRRALMEELNRL